jgi:hypothetical protein
MTFTAIPTQPVLATNNQHTDLVSVVSECTVAQAAKILDMSEGCVNELLRDKVITSRLVGDERLVQWDSLIGYSQERNRRRAILAEMVRLDQEMGLYDD